jgi:hypothetical protein
MRIPEPSARERKKKEALLLPSSGKQASTHLLPTAKKELVRVNAIRDGTPDKRHPVKHHGRLVGVLEQQLLEHIQHDNQHRKRGGGSSDNDAHRLARHQTRNRPSNNTKNPHNKSPILLQTSTCSSSSSQLAVSAVVVVVVVVVAASTPFNFTRPGKIKSDSGEKRERG